MSCIESRFSHIFSCCCWWVTSVLSDSVRPHRWQPTRLPHRWDSPGKNTGVGCHFLLQCMKVKSESEVAQSCPTLSDPMDCSLRDSSVHGIFQARVLEWGAIALSKLCIHKYKKNHVQFYERYGKICNVSKKKNNVKLTRSKLLLNQAWMTIMTNHLFSLHISQIMVFGIVLPFFFFFFQSNGF